MTELGQETEVLPALAEGVERLVFAGPEAVDLMTTYKETLSTSDHPAIAETRPTMEMEAPPTFVDGGPGRGGALCLCGTSIGAHRPAVVCAADHSVLHEAALHIAEWEFDNYAGSFHRLMKERGARRVFFHCDHSDSRGPCTARTFLCTLQKKKDDAVRVYVLHDGNRARDRPEVQSMIEQANEAARAAGLCTDGKQQRRDFLKHMQAD